MDNNLVIKSSFIKEFTNILILLLNDNDIGYYHDEDSCVICGEKNEDDKCVMYNKCYHLFHLKCILKNIDKNNTYKCPICQ